ncbi:MAG: hypothetical protein AAF921_16625 [Cyanobacteria bacterium P01_D01_bin.44]
MMAAITIRKRFETALLLTSVVTLTQAPSLAMSSNQSLIKQTDYERIFEYETIYNPISLEEKTLSAG